MRPVLLAFAAFAVSARAQLPVPRLDHAFPPGARQGTEVELTLAGPDLADVSSILFDTPGLTALKVDGLKFKVTVSPEAAVGVHELRALGKYGLSSPKPFVVGSAAEFLDVGTNHTKETAMPLATPCVVEGRFDAEQRDFYKAVFKKDAPVLITCHSYAFDAPGDPVITVLGANGKSIARADDERDRDALLKFVAPADGEYLIAVHDKLFAGGAAYLYRLSIGEGQPLSLRHPASACDFSVGSPKLIQEHDNNDTAATAQPIEVPADVGGTFDVDWFTFSAEKGRAFWIEVIAARADEEVDPVITIHKVTKDAEGKEQSKQVLELDDQGDLPAPPRWQAGTTDPAGKFTPDETATYRIRVADRTGSHAPYRLIVREALPDFVVLAIPESPLDEPNKHFIWQPVLRRGGGSAFRIAVLRRGYEGEITLSAEDLPEGVTAFGRVPAGLSTGTLVFNCDVTTKPWANFVKILAEGGGVKREVAGLTYRWSVGNRDSERLDSRLCRTAISVIDEATPLSIAPVESREYEGALGASVEVPLKLTRPAPLAVPKGEWQLSPVGFPGLAKFDPLKVDGGSATEAKLVIPLVNKDGNNFQAGTYQFHLQARGTVSWKADEKSGAKDGKDLQFSTPITVKIVPPAAPATAAAKP
jgi:hypothetical protein